MNAPVLKACILLAMLLPQAAAADTLARIRDSGTIRVGHRVDALPHSYVDASGRPVGYIVDICRSVADSVQKHLALSELKTEFVKVTAQNRFEAVRENRIDLLCEPSSITLSRREMVDFSLPTYVDGAGVAFRGEEIARFEDFAGRKVGVLGDTTTHTHLRTALAQLGIKANVEVSADHRAGIRALADGKIDAYFADRAILAYLASRLDKSRNVRIGKRYFSYETYALALTRGDNEFRLVVDRALARMARGGEMYAIAHRNFGNVNDELLGAMIAIISLPD